MPTSVKSLRAVECDSAEIEERGFANDRRFMIVSDAPLPLTGEFGPSDATKRFLTQRQCPTLATVVADLQPGSLTLSSHVLPGVSVTIATTPAPNAARYLSKLWDDKVQVVDLGDEAATFLLQVLDKDADIPDEMKWGVRLVVQASDDERSSNAYFVPAAARSISGQTPAVALSDGFPILIACQASLDELNRRLVAKSKPPLPMSRFRPNIVIEGTEPFEEDYWKVIRIGDAVLHVVKGCPRCKESCTDQVTGVVTKEPLATMADFRALDKSNKDNLFFAQNVVPGLGAIGKRIAVGTQVEVLQRGQPVFEDGGW